jgi:hypothetical protein
MNAKQFAHFHSLCQQLADFRSGKSKGAQAVDQRVAEAKAALRGCLPRSGGARSVRV